MPTAALAILMTAVVASAVAAMSTATATAAAATGGARSSRSSDDVRTDPTGDRTSLDNPLEVVNPWLSACDLAQPATAPDLQGACGAVASSSPARRLHHHIDEGPGPPPSSCPSACSGDLRQQRSGDAARSNQCLDYLGEAQQREVCDLNRHELLGRLRLRHCCEHVAQTALSARGLADVRAGGRRCHRVLGALRDTDTLAARIFCEFTEVLTRYDCGQPYSIVYHCEDCKEAYRRWVCSSLVPYLAKSNELDIAVGNSGGRNSSVAAAAMAVNDGERLIRVRPCRSVCQTVEQRCPYMLPGDRAPAYPTQYAGEPTFLCLDPNIPETGEQRTKSSHGSEECCYVYDDERGGVRADCPASGRALLRADELDGERYNESAWRVNCGLSANGSSGDSSGTSAASAPTCTLPSVPAAATSVPSRATSVRPSCDRRAIMLIMLTGSSCLTVLTSATWTTTWWTFNKAQLIIKILMITFVINILYSLLLMFVNGAYVMWRRLLDFAVVKVTKANYYCCRVLRIVLPVVIVPANGSTKRYATLTNHFAGISSKCAKLTMHFVRVTKNIVKLHIIKSTRHFVSVAYNYYYYYILIDVDCIFVNIVNLTNPRRSRVVARAPKIVASPSPIIIIIIVDGSFRQRRRSADPSPPTKTKACVRHNKNGGAALASSCSVKLTMLYYDMSRNGGGGRGLEADRRWRLVAGTLYGKVLKTIITIIVAKWTRKLVTRKNKVQTSCSDDNINYYYYYYYSDGGLPCS